MCVFDMRAEPDGADKFLGALAANVHKRVLADVELQSLVLGGSVAAELASEGPLIPVDQHMPVAIQFVFELAFTDLTVVQKLPLAFPSHQAELVKDVLHLFVLQVMGFLDMLDQVFDIRVFFLAEAAVLLDLLVDSLHMDFKVAFAQAGERAVIAGELLSRVLPQVDVQVGLDGTGVVAEGAFVGLLVGVDPQVGLKGVLEFEHLVAILAGENF